MIANLNNALWRIIKLAKTWKSFLGFDCLGIYYVYCIMYCTYIVYKHLIDLMDLQGFYIEFSFGHYSSFQTLCTKLVL